MTGQQTSGASLLHFTTTILVLADSLNHSDQFTRRDSLVENEPSTTPTSVAYRAVAFGYFEVMSQQVETSRRPVATSIRYLITLNWSSEDCRNVILLVVMCYTTIQADQTDSTIVPCV